MSDAWSRLESLVREALSLPVADRAAFLDRACRGDPALRHEVTSILAQEAAAESFLEVPPVSARSSTLVGRQLGPYRIDAWLGAGGMGDVYRARDVVLDRDIALKVLSPLFASDPDGLARLEREARILATLNHPHIASIHGLVGDGRIPALVLELLDGETLAERLTRGPLPPGEAFRVAAQITDALSAAHHKGIVHRDLKPANIQITGSGAVKLFDFGIAKAGALAAAGARALTREGSVIGTAAYMSPEQARGDLVDRQTDVWGFGCVLFEMLTGARAFDAPTPSDTIAAVLERDPAWSALPAGTPEAVRSLLRRCLHKDKTRRLRDLSDARLEIEEQIAAGSSGVSASSTSASNQGNWRLHATLATALASGCVTVALGWMLFRSSAVATAPDLHAEISTLQRVTESVAQGRHFDISPDGRMLAYSQDAGIVLRSLAHRTGVVLDGTDGGSFPTFSPDSQQIAFARGGVLYRTSITGGAPSEVTRAWVFPGLDWGEDGYLYYASGVGTSGIWRVRAQGGELPERVTTVRDADDENLHSWPQLLPGGKALLYTAVGPSGGAVDSRVMVQTLESDSPRILVEAAIYGRYVRSGHLIYAKNDGTLYAARLDAATLKMGETHAAIQSDVATAIWGGAAFVVASATGTEVYLPRSDQTAFDFHLTDRQGRLTGPSITSEVMARIGRSSMLGDLSPDGQQIAVTGESPGAIDIWVLPVGGSEPRRLTLDPAEDEFPVWKSDGSAIAYTSANTGTTRRIIVQELNGGRRVVRTWPRHAHVNAWSPDGRWLILSNYTKTHEEDLWGLSIDGRNLLPVATSSSSEGDAAFSFDGNWLAYSSSDRDSQEIFVTSFPSLETLSQVSTSGGFDPHWDAAGRLYYLSQGSLMMQPIDLKTGIPAGRPSQLFRSDAVRFDLSADGQRFLFQVRNPEHPPLLVRTNWFDEIRTRLK